MFRRHAVDPAEVGHEDALTTLYALSGLKSEFEHEVICQNTHLFWYKQEPGWLYFLVVEEALGGFIGTPNEGEWYCNPLVSGEGSIGYVKELRHMWWGSPGEGRGYLHYNRPEQITAIGNALERWFGTSKAPSCPSLC